MDKAIKTNSESLKTKYDIYHFYGLGDWMYKWIDSFYLFIVYITPKAQFMKVITDKLDFTKTKKQNKTKLLFERQCQKSEKKSHSLGENICKKTHLIMDCYSKYTKNS